MNKKEKKLIFDEYGIDRTVKKLIADLKKFSDRNYSYRLEIARLKTELKNVKAEQKISTNDKNLERKIEAFDNLRVEAEWGKAEIAKLDTQVARLKFMNGELYKMGKGLCE